MKKIKAESGKFCDLVINPEDLPPIEAGECFQAWGSVPSFEGKVNSFTLKFEQMKQYMATYFNGRNVPVGIHIFEALNIERAHSICKGDDYARGRASYTLAEVVPVASEVLGSYKDVTQCSLMVGDKEFARVNAQVVPPLPVRGDFRFTNEEE